MKVRFPRFGTFRIVGPITSGQSVTVQFFELDPSRFYATGEHSRPDILRHHGLFATCTPDLHSDSQAFAVTDEGLLRIGTEDAVTEITIDGDGIVRVGSHTATDFVALASLVIDRLNELKDAISGAAVVPTDGGAAFKANIIAALDFIDWPVPVAAEKVKAL